jgi:hypothetical protein
VNSDIENTKWWLLQVQFPDRYGKQLHLFPNSMSRKELLEESIKVVPENIKIIRGASTWGFANLIKINSELYTFYLTVKHPKARIAEEPKPGHIQDAKDSKFYTLCVINIKRQIIMVHRGSDVSRYARSAQTYAAILQELIEKAVSFLQMKYYYIVEVDPIAQIGSFVQWVEDQDVLKKIIIKYAGPNLPSGASNLIKDIKESARLCQSALKSKYVELVANDPDIDDEEVLELDKAVANRRLKIKAKGIKSGVNTTWSSSDKPIPETATMPFGEKTLEQESFVAEKVNTYINEKFKEY